MDKILVTRPEADFERTKVALSDLGFVALSAPMMTFELKPFNAPSKDEISALVFTSANGIRALQGRVDLQCLPCYVVGEQSSILAAESGYEILARGDGDVQSLSDVIEHDYLARGLTKPLLHISGVHQAGNLSQILNGKGLKIDRVQAYEMVEATALDAEIIQTIEKNEIAGMLFYSKRTAQIFIKNIQENGLLQKIRPIAGFCLSKNIADALSKPYLEHIYFVDQPNENALLKLVRSKLK